MSEQVNGPFEPEEAGTQESGPIDPFGEDSVKQVQLIVLMRNYDVLMTILNHLDPDKANNLHEIHSAGGLVGALPSLDLSDG